MLAISIETPFVTKNTTYTNMLLDTDSQVTVMQGYSTNLETFNNKKGLIEGLGET